MNKIVIKNAFNLKWHPEQIGKIYTGDNYPPPYCQYEETEEIGYAKLTVVENDGTNHSTKSMIKISVTNGPLLTDRGYLDTQAIVENPALIDCEFDRSTKPSKDLYSTNYSHSMDLLIKTLTLMGYRVVVYTAEQRNAEKIAKFGYAYGSVGQIGKTMNINDFVNTVESNKKVMFVMHMEMGHKMFIERMQKGILCKEDIDDDSPVKIVDFTPTKQDSYGISNDK